MAKAKLVTNTTSGPRANKKYRVVTRGAKKYHFYEGGPHVLVKPKAGNPSAGGVANPSSGGTAVAPKPAAAAPPDPFAALTPQQIAAAAHSQAMAGLQPQLNIIQTQQNRATSANANRNQQLAGWGVYQQNTLNDAFNQTRDALNKLVGATAKSGQDSQDSLTAALGQGAQNQANLGTLIGGNTSQPGDEAALLQQAAMDRSSNDAFNGQNMAAQLGLASANQGLAGVMHDQLSDDERRRFNAQQQDLNDQQSQVMAGLPDLLANATNDIQGQEEKKANDKATLAQAKAELGETKAARLFQQYITEKQFDQSVKNDTFDHWLSKQNLSLAQTTQGDVEDQNAASNAIDWANVGINRTQANAALQSAKNDAASATTADGKERSKLRAQAIINARGVLASFMAAQPGENQPGNPTAGLQAKGDGTYTDSSGKTVRPYVRHFDDALRKLMSIDGMAEVDALKILSGSDFPSWRAAAKQRLDIHRGHLNHALKVNISGVKGKTKSKPKTKAKKKAK